MKLHVRYSAQLRVAVGKAGEIVEVPEATSLADLIAFLATHCDSAAAPHLLTSDGRPRPSLLLVVNDDAIATSRANETVLQDGDQVALLPPIGGG